MCNCLDNFIRIKFRLAKAICAIVWTTLFFFCFNSLSFCLFFCFLVFLSYSLFVFLSFCHNKQGKAKLRCSIYVVSMLYYMLYLCCICEVSYVVSELYHMLGVWQKSYFDQKPSFPFILIHLIDHQSDIGNRTFFSISFKLKTPQISSKRFSNFYEGLKVKISFRNYKKFNHNF